MQSVTVFNFFCFLTQNAQLISKSFHTNTSDGLSGHNLLLLYLHRTLDFCCCYQSVVHLIWWGFIGHPNTWLIWVSPFPESDVGDSSDRYDCVKAWLIDAPIAAVLEE